MRTMPRTVGHKGEYLSQCQVCGSMYWRSMLVRGRDGLLRCAQDQPGRDEMTLAEVTAAQAAAIAEKATLRTPADGATPDTDYNGDPVTSTATAYGTSRFTAAQVYGGKGGIPSYTHSKLGRDGF